MEKKAQSKGRGRKRKSNQQVSDVNETEDLKTEEAGCSKVVPSFNKKKRTTKKQQEKCQSNNYLINVDEEKGSQNEREDDDDTQTTLPDDINLKDTSDSSSMLADQTEAKDIGCLSVTKSDNMNVMVTESNCKSSEKVDSMDTTDVRIEDPLPTGPLQRTSKGSNNGSEPDSKDSAEAIKERLKSNDSLQFQFSESGSLKGLIDVHEIQDKSIEIPAKNTEIPANHTKIPSKNTETQPEKTQVIHNEKENVSPDQKLSTVQLKEDHKKEGSKDGLGQVENKQEPMTVTNETILEDKEEKNSNTVQKHDKELPEAAQSEKEIPSPVRVAQDEISNPVTYPGSKVDQQDSVVEQEESSNQIPLESEQGAEILKETEITSSIQELQTNAMKSSKTETTNGPSPVKFNVSHNENQLTHKGSRKCFSLEDDTFDSPNIGDTKQELKGLVSTGIEQEDRLPTDKLGESDVSQEKTDPSDKEKENLLVVSSPLNIIADTTEKAQCEDGLEGDLDITDSQLCEAVNIQESNSTLNSLEEVKKRHLEGRKIIRDLIVDLSYLNKMLLRTKREIEIARRKKQSGGNRNSR